MDQRGEGALKVGGGSTHLHEVQVYPQLLCRRLELRERYPVEGMVRGDEHSHAGGGWHHLLEQFQRFRRVEIHLTADPRDVPAWLSPTGDDAAANRIGRT